MRNLAGPTQAEKSSLRPFVPGRRWTLDDPRTGASVERSGPPNPQRESALQEVEGASPRSFHLLVTRAGRDLIRSPAAAGHDTWGNCREASLLATISRNSAEFATRIDQLSFREPASNSRATHVWPRNDGECPTVLDRFLSLAISTVCVRLVPVWPRFTRRDEPL